MMVADLHTRADGYRRYLVFDDVSVPRKCWSAVHNVVTGRWEIENLRGGIPVSDFGRLGSRIVSVCEREFERIESRETEEC